MAAGQALKARMDKTGLGRFADRWHLLLAGVFVLGFFVRLFGLASLVTGINADEASIGYDAWAIANYGIDRNGVSMPSYLIAWGSGQNAGYAYLLIPFVKLFGLSLLTVRLPMALAGCASLWALYTILRRAENRNLALLGVFLLAICPWHIVKSRWALESNLFPDMLLWAAALLCTGLATGHKRWYYLACAVFGLSAWAYATSFVMLPLILIPAAVVLWRQKALGLPHLAGCAGVFLLCCLPVALFALANLTGWRINIPFFTIPTLVQSRGGEFALLGQNPLGQMLQNAKNTLAIVLAQDDGTSWGVVQGFGLIYLFSLPLAIAGFLRVALPGGKGGRWRGLVPGGWLFVPWFLAAAFLSVMLDPNINRINGLWFPLVWFWILGVWEVFCAGAFWRRFVVALYGVFFLLFCNSYLKVQVDRFNYAFDAGFLEAVAHVDEMDKPVYVSGAGPPYIKVLFQTKTPPAEFRASIVYEETGAYGNVFEWGKWTVAEPESPEAAGDYALIVRAGKEGPYLDAGWDLVNYGDFWAGEAADG